MYLQEIYQSSNKEMFAISLSSCSRYNANFKGTMSTTMHCALKQCLAAILLAE